ncbi:hypothetical protein [Bifidobacterium psychraerophilum]|uniref:Uncharacterized protein n=1 Tax=Bifidobacterium psychraerophilum TaxID=218140 RepID=A0A087CG82_9BIFI|nr:hypothetical protein [Bifidobacterium psychraerophilum]KFI82282.1 hypothetical protein BPSY_1131 [Bifidobacterium psychraerophilum]
MDERTRRSLVVRDGMHSAELKAGASLKLIVMMRRIILMASSMRMG